MREPWFSYTILDKPDVPSIRLPCYNITLQCVYEMAYHDLKEFLLRPSEAFQLAGELKDNELIMRRHCPDNMMLLAMKLWPFWERLALTMPNRIKMLLRTARVKDKNTKKQDATMIRSINRIFEKHLARKTVS